MNTRFHYMYRDASNYKYWGEVVFAGAIDDALSGRLSRAFESTEFFIADQIGIREVFPADWPLDQDDHCWHTFVETESTNEAADDVHGRTIHRFVADVERTSIKGWKVFDPMTRARVRRKLA